jgi:hypothetical protein
MTSSFVARYHRGSVRTIQTRLPFNLSSAYCNVALLLTSPFLMLPLLSFLTITFNNLSHIRTFPSLWEGEPGQFTQNSDYDTNCASEGARLGSCTAARPSLVTMASHGAHNSPHLMTGLQSRAATLLLPDMEDSEVYSRL